jgi:alpha-D-ribose 1-methylphosphonate 5-triphosphate synthase subunit PhnG
MHAAQPGWDQARLSRVCALGDPTVVARLAGMVRATAGSVVPLREATTELVLLEVADPVGGGSFYLGEVLVTTALVEVDGVAGGAVVVGNDPERARAAALLDAALRRPDRDGRLVDALAREEASIARRHRREWARVDRTRVQFETMEDTDPFRRGEGGAGA